MKCIRISLNLRINGRTKKYPRIKILRVHPESVSSVECMYCNFAGKSYKKNCRLSISFALCAETSSMKRNGTVSRPTILQLESVLINFPKHGTSISIGYCNEISHSDVIFHITSSAVQIKMRRAPSKLKCGLSEELAVAKFR